MSTPTIPVEPREDIDPICPHCSDKLKTIYNKQLDSFLGKRFVYFCPHCHKTLGITHRKGFWMG